MNARPGGRRGCSKPGTRERLAISSVGSVQEDGHDPITEKRETVSLIGSDKVQGTAVYGADGDKIGSIERVMIEKISGRVSYAVLSFGGFLGIGDDYYPLPWPSLKYNVDLGGYQTLVPIEKIKGAPKYARNGAWDWELPARTGSMIITASFRPDTIRIRRKQQSPRIRGNGMRKMEMRMAWIAAVSALALTGSLASAQNANTTSTTPPGDAAVSPATANPAGGSSRTDRPSPGAGVNSGAMNNGTTGDTIGTGSGTSSGPVTGTAGTAGVRKE